VQSASASWLLAAPAESVRYFPVAQLKQSPAAVFAVNVLYLPYAHTVQSATESWLAAVVVASTRYVPTGHAVHAVAVAIVAV